MKIILNWRVCVGVLMAALLFPLANAAGLDDPIPLDPAVRTGTLPNGLKYFIRRNVKPEKRVELRLAVNIGSVNEDDDQLGIAHLIEHLCFAGTKSFSRMELLHYLQSIGASFGPDINAYTSFDETVYQLSLASDSEEILKNGLKIMREWAHDVTLDNAEIDRERNVVIEEWRLGRGAGQRMRDKFLPVVFKDSKYATRLPIGTKESIEKVSYDTVKRFYHDWYRPDNMAFVVVGDIDPDKIEASIRADFGNIPAVEHPRAKEKYTVPDHDQPLYANVSDHENANNVVFLLYKTDADLRHTQADYRRELTEHLFLRLLNLRLDELRQQAEPPFLQAGAGYGRLGARDKKAYQLSAYVAENGIQKGMTAVLTENERIRQHGFTAAELERGKRAMLKNLEQSYLERDKTESNRLVGQYVSYFLEQEPAPGIEFEYEFAKRHLDEVTLDDVNHLATQWITTGKNRVIVTESVEKPGVKMPTDAEVQAVVDQVAKTPVTPYQEKQLAKSLLEKKPAPGKVSQEKPIEGIGVTELTLSNGIRVVLKPSTFKNDEIIFSAYREGGGSLFSDDYNLSAQLADECAIESGVAQFSKVDLQKMLSGKVVTVIPQLNTYYEGMRGRCSVADLESMMQLIYLYFTQPRADETAFQSLVTRRKAALKNALSNPMTAFFNDLAKIRYQNHPRNPRVLPTDEDWAKVTWAKTTEVYRTRFSNASGFTFVVVGSFAVDTIKPLLETYLGSLPSKSEPSAWKDLGIRSISGPFDQKIVHGTDPKSMAVISLEGPTDYSRDEAHVLSSLGGVIQRLLIDRLRQDMGGVYAPRCSAYMSRVPYPHFVFEVMIPCAPENVEKLTDAAYDEIKKVQTNGVKPEDIQKEVETQRRAAEKDAQDNNAWGRKLEQIYRDHESFGRVADPNELIKLVTSENLQRVANKYLDTTKTVRFVMYPETK